MKSKRNLLWFLLLCLSLTILVFLQIWFVKTTLHSKNEEFHLQVQGKLNQIKKEIEEAHYCFQLYSEITLLPGQGLFLTTRKLPSSGATDTLKEFFFTDLPLPPIFPITGTPPLNMIIPFMHAYS